MERLNNTHILGVLVEHKPGVLQRISGMFGRRNFNIDSISVGKSNEKGLARMTLRVRGDEKVLEQIIKQLNKLINVIKVSDITHESVERELCLVKLHAPSIEIRSRILQYMEVFRGRTVDITPESITVEVTGTSEKIDAFITLAKSIGIKELARTGLVAMVRGPKSISTKK